MTTFQMIGVVLLILFVGPLVTSNDRA